MSRDGPSILLVDDDVDICSNLSDILGDLGYRVDAAYDGPSALAMIERTRYDVAVLDYKMPGMNGATLTREIRRMRPEMVSLLVTAHASTASDEALSAGAWHVLAKPVDTPRLLGLVDQALDQPLILVVDDDLDLCANLWDLLRERGYRVGLAHSGEEASRSLAEAMFHVVLIDVKLPDGDGSEVFRKVCEVNPEARTVVITGQSSGTFELVDKILSEGADAVCYKPFDVPKLLESLERLTATRTGREPR
jgi:two-component system, NtrC family, response regulator HydG